MEMNLHILADALVGNEPRLSHPLSRERTIARFDFYHGQDAFADDCLYLICGASIPPEFQPASGWWLIYGADPPSAVPDLGLGALAVTLPDDGMAAASSVSRIFSFYEAWSERLLTLGIAHEGIRLIFTSGLLDEAFENPILMQDGVGLFTVAAGSLPDDFDNEWWMSVINYENAGKGGHLKGEEGDAAFAQSDQGVRCFRTARYEFLQTALLADGDFSGCLTHCACSRPFSEGYISLAEYLNEVLGKIVRRNMKDGMVGKGEDTVFIELLNHRYQSPEWLKGHLSRIGWKEGECAFLVVVTQRSGKREGPPLPLKRLVWRLKARLKGSFAFEYKGGAVAVVRCSDYCYDSAALQRDLSWVLGDVRAFCLVSLEFFDICKIRNYYDQCLFLLSHESGNSDERIRFYEYEFFQHFLLHYGIERDLDWLIDPRVQVLRDYDARNGGNLVGCFKTLIECCGNKKLAAEKLSIHYNTLLYRIDRIKELSGLDISDFDNEFGSALFRVLFSLKLVDELR